MYRLLLAAGFLLTACSVSSIKSERTPSSVPGQITAVDDDFIDALQPVGDQSILKFSVIKDATGKYSQLYIQDPKIPFHHLFLTTLPEFKGMDQKQIEALTFKKSPERKAYIGVFSVEAHWFADMDRAARTGFYIMSEDLPDVAVLSDIRNKLNSVIHINRGTADNFIPLPTQETETTSRLNEFKGKDLKVLFENRSSRQAYSEGWAIGDVKVLNTQADLDVALQQDQISKNTILILGESVRELPPCAGVISGVPLTPGSHLSLLAQMYGVPLVYEQGALQKYAASAGKTVFLSSNLQSDTTFQFLASLTGEEIRILKDAKKINPLNFEFDPTVKDIVEVRSLQRANVKSYGGKASQFGLLRRVIPDNTLPVAVGIPLYYYMQFIQQSKAGDVSLQALVSRELAALPAEATYNQVDQAAEKIRAAFKTAAISAEFFTSLQTAVAKAANNPARLKLRSSSNVEDGAEFNGAGLYDSEGVCMTNCAKPDFEKGLRKVWGSLYTGRGLWARRSFKVDDNRVGMALLAHVPFKNELFNGVARISTRKDYDKLFSYTEITTQQGEDASVTNAVGAGSAELASVVEEKVSIKIPFKGLPQGRTLMKVEHYKKLDQLMQSLLKSWDVKSPSLEIEAEWKVMLDNGVEKVFVKQVRQVPKQNRIRLADQSKRLWLTGGIMQFKNFGESSWDAVSGLYRVRDIKIPLKSFTEKELKAGKLSFGVVEATYKDRTVKLTAGRIKAETLSYGATGITVDLVSDELPAFKLKFSLAETTDNVISFTSEAFGLEYETKTKILRNTRFDKSSGTLRPALVYLDRLQTDTDAPKSIKVSTEKGCPIVISAKTNVALKIYDSSRMYLQPVDIAGFLPGKNIHLTQTYDSFHVYHIHDGLKFLILDLLADPSLTPEDKMVLARYGRYINIDLDYPDVPGQFTARYEIFKSDFSKGAAPKGCHPEESIHGGGNGDEE